MPTYTYACPVCETQFEKFLPISQYNSPQTCECGELGKRQLTVPNFVLKGDDWPSKNGRIRQQMSDKNKVLDRKQNERKREAPGMTLAPNVEGERVDSWSEAQKLAVSQGKSGSSYDAKIREEKVLK